MTVVLSVIDSPGTRPTIGDVAGTVITSVEGSNAYPPSAGRVCETMPVQVPDGRSGSPTPVITMSTPDAALLVRLPKCGV